MCLGVCGDIENLVLGLVEIMNLQDNTFSFLLWTILKLCQCHWLEARSFHYDPGGGSFGASLAKDAGDLLWRY